MPNVVAMVYHETFDMIFLSSANLHKSFEYPHPLKKFFEIFM